MRRFRKYTLIVFAFLAAIVSPVGVKMAHAGPIDWLLSALGSTGEGIAYLVAMVIQYLVYIPSGWVLRAAAFVFDAVVPYSLGIALPGQSAFQSAFITEGWGLMRDITNMVFIFAMLYIAIATILQLGAGRNTKALIMNIIMVALFVNFSLFLAQVVIDGANLLAYEFYKALTASPQGLAAIFLTGFDPQQLLGTRSFNNWVTEYNQSNTVLVVLYLFGGVVQFVAAYMIFWAAFLFIGRIVILWILMILSPLAFAAYIIPGTQGWFKKWWDNLLNQAFVAPIFLFFFFIFALFLQSGLKGVLTETASRAGGGGVIEAILKVSLGFSLVVAFLVVALRMTKTYAGEAGAWATKLSGTAIGFAAGGLGGAVLGAGGGGRVAQLARMIPGVGGVVGGTLLGVGEKVGRVSGAPLRVPLRGVAGVAGEAAGKAGGVAREAAGKAAKGLVEAGTKQTLGGTLLRGLGIARGAAQVEAVAKAGSKAAIEKAEKDLEGLSENALRTEYGYATTTAEKRAGIIKILGKKKKLQSQEEGAGPMTHDSIVKTLETVKDRGYNTEKEIENLYLWQYAKKREEFEKAAKTMSVDAFKEIAKEKTEDENGEKTVPSKFFDDPAVFKILMQNVTSGHLNTLADPETNKNFADNFFGQLKEAVKEARQYRLKKLQEEAASAGKPMSEEAIKAFIYTVNDYFKEKDINNSRGGQWASTLQGKGQLGTANIPYKEEQSQKTKEETEEKADKEAQKKKDEEQAERDRKEKFYQEFYGGGENKT